MLPLYHRLRGVPGRDDAGARGADRLRRGARAVSELANATNDAPIEEFKATTRNARQCVLCSATLRKVRPGPL